MSKYRIKAMLKKTLIVIPITLVLLTGLLPSCALDNFSPLGTLNPPLVLSLSNNSTDLHVSFIAQNSQTYFSGYTVYLGANETEVTNQTYPVTNNNGYLPTYDPYSPSYTTNYTIIISNTSGFNGGAAFSVSDTVYVGVAAYGSDNGDPVTSIVAVVSNITF